MCSQTNQQTIDAVITDFIGQGRAFTAYDVSKEAQARGADERHRDMRDYIHSSSILHNEVGFGSYRKTQLHFVGGESPFLYHHETYDPATYQPANGKVLSVSAPASPAIVANAVSSVPTITGPISTSHVRHKNDDGTFTLGYGSSLLIELQYVKACGLNPGDTVYVYPNDDKVILSKTNPGNGRAKRIEQRGGIRLSQISLKEAGLVGDNYKVENAKIDDATVVQVSVA